MGDTVNLVKNLVSEPHEQEWFEFKENWFEPNAIGEYVSALSNAAACAGREEAYLIWGVNDRTHGIVGTTFDYHSEVKGEPLQHFLARQLTPDVLFNFEEAVIDGKRVVVLRIPAAKRVPTSFAGIRYQRIGSSKVNLAKHPEREAALFGVLAQGPLTMENVVAVDQEMDFGKLFTYYAGRGIELNRKTFEKNLGLLDEHGNRNLLAQVLSDDSRMPVRVSVFKGEDKSSILHSVKEFGNTCLLVTLDKVLEYGDVINIVQADERGRDVARKDVPLFDPDLFREAVVNAFVHNRWVDGNAPMITVYSDRMEILSRGTLPPNQTVEGFFLGESVPVNKRLSDIFLQLHISERSGRGVPKIVKRYGRNAYQFRKNSIVLTIPFDRIDVPGQRAESPSRIAADEGLNQTQLRVLDEMRNNPNVTHAQLMALSGKGKTTIQNAVTFLKGKGFVERVGSDKTGYWNVLK